MAFEELDEFSFQIKPTTEDISIGIEFWLDGDGDGKWSSKSDRDLKLYAKPNIWELIKWPQNQWTSVETFDFEYSNKSTTKKPINSATLYKWLENYTNLRLVTAQIKLYKSYGGICLIDYININGMVASFEPNEGPYEKVGKPSRIIQNGKITYT